MAVSKKEENVKNKITGTEQGVGLHQEEKRRIRRKRSILL